MTSRSMSCNIAVAFSPLYAEIQLAGIYVGKRDRPETIAGTAKTCIAGPASSRSRCSADVSISAVGTAPNTLTIWRNSSSILENLAGQTGSSIGTRKVDRSEPYCSSLHCCRLWRPCVCNIEDASIPIGLCGGPGKAGGWTVSFANLSTDRS